MRDWLKACIATLGWAAALALCACGGGGDMGGGMNTGSATSSPSGSSNGTGTMSVSMADAPACGFDAVNVTVRQVRIHPSSSAAPADAGWTDITLTSPLRVNLLTLTNGMLVNLGQTSLPAGNYRQIRLVLVPNDASNPLANSVVPSGGNELPLSMPSDVQSGIKITVDINISANQSADFVIDFSACPSVVTAGSSGQFSLKPVLSVTPMFISGVQGFVDLTLASATTAVSLQDASGAIVKATVPDSTGQVLLQPVAPGTYTLVVTAPGRATAAIAGVVVVTNAITPLNTSDSPITLPPSQTATLTGTVSIAQSTDSMLMTGMMMNAAQPIDVTVAALQSFTLSGGGTIEVASMGVDSMTGNYALTVPVAAPIVATFTAPLAMRSFAPDTRIAGTYTLKVTSDGMAELAGPITLSAGATVPTDFTFP